MGGMSKWRKERPVIAPAPKRADRPRPEMRMSIERVTPETALRWLAANPSNRPISEDQVKRYAADMKRDDWKTTHQGIAFDASGNLLDGQHRLRAIVRAGITVMLVVFRNCDRDSFDRLDTGKKRTAADALAIDGMDAARAVAAIARNIIKYGFKDSSVTDSFVVEFAREQRDELAEYVPLVSTLTAPGAAAFAFASTDMNLKSTVRRLMNDPNGREMDDLRRCIRLLSTSTGSQSARSRYTLAMNAIIRADGGRGG